MHPNYYEVTEVASYTYEAITTSKGMVLNNIGSGSKYLGAYIDDEGNWLDGKNNYEIIDFDKFIQMKPDHILIFPWNIENEITEQIAAKLPDSQIWVAIPNLRRVK